MKLSKNLSLSARLSFKGSTTNAGVSEQPRFRASACVRVHGVDQIFAGLPSDACGPSRNTPFILWDAYTGCV